MFCDVLRTTNVADVPCDCHLKLFYIFYIIVYFGIAFWFVIVPATYGDIGHY